MKSVTFFRNSVLLAIVGLSIFQANSATIENALEHRLTVQLTLTKQGPTTTKDTKDGYTTSQTILTEKFTNKTVLEIVQRDGLISEIKGWSIVMITNEGEFFAVYLKKSGEEAVEITDYFDSRGISENYRIDQGRVTSRTDESNEYTTEESSIKTLAFLDFNWLIEGISVSLTGPGVLTGKRRILSTRSLAANPPSETSTVFLDDFVIQAIRGSSEISGDTAPPNFSDVFVEGSYRGAKGIKTDIDFTSI